MRLVTREPITERLAAYAIAPGPFPAAVRAMAKRMILDQIACQIAGAPLPWSRAYRASLASLGSGTGAHSVYYGDRLAVDQAAFLNSAFGHADEFDDTHLGSNMHPSAIIVPAVLALAERDALDGARVLDATIAGTEVMLRIATAVSPYLHARGHYTPAAVGAFGAAAGCARLLGFDAEHALHALAIAGSHAAGHNEFTRSGGSVKRILCAIPAMSGLRSAVMAGHGITGPRTAIEGDAGFLEVFSGEYDSEKITAGLGEEYVLLATSFKPYACNLSLHAAVEALGLLADEHRFDAGEVTSIAVGTSARAIDNCGAITYPSDVLGAQTSIAFSCAVRLLRGGNGPHDYRTEDVADPRFRDLAGRVELFVDAQSEEERATIRNRAAVVTVRTTGGRSYERRVRFSKGSPENPLTDADLTAKFTTAVEPLLGAARTAALADRIWHFDDLAAAGEIVGLTAAAADAERNSPRSGG